MLYHLRDFLNAGQWLIVAGGEADVFSSNDRYERAAAADAIAEHARLRAYAQTQNTGTWHALCSILIVGSINSAVTIGRESQWWVEGGGGQCSEHVHTN